jgi:type IV pilus assembly protein PilN
LSQSQFLNQMFASKAFSWTAVMMDLENVLPAGVQVLNIDPVIDKDGKVTIRLRVNGPHDRGVDLVRNLERSHRFLAPRLARETAEANPNQRQIETVGAPNNVNFDLLAEYNPLPDTGSKKAHDATTAPAKRKAVSSRGPRAKTRARAVTQ